MGVGAFSIFYDELSQFMYILPLLIFKTKSMRKTTKNFLLTLMTVGLFFACSTNEEGSINDELGTKELRDKVVNKSLLPELTKETQRITWNESAITAIDFGLKKSVFNAVEPSQCESTPFRAVLDVYNDLLFDDFFSIWDGNIDAYYLLFFDYFDINYIAARIEDKNTDYFGESGEDTNYVNNRVRSLENFWEMPDIVQVKGQHTSTLEDLDFIRYVYENYSPYSPEVIDYLVAMAEQYNNAGSQFPENPFYASDGFATFDGIIVIGDGLVNMLSEVGLDPKVVWSSILAHEWGHQIQFVNYGDFDYPVPPFIKTPESTRMTELEADFITGYYLTHKRGATYNWEKNRRCIESIL